MECRRRAVSLVLMGATALCVAALPAVAQAVSLAPPVLIAPTGTLSEAAPEFSWRDVAGATHFQLWIDDSTGTLLQTWYTASAIGCGSGICRVRPGVAPAAGPGTWWVRSWNAAAGNSLWGSGLTFRRVPPLAALPLSPSGVATANPTFTWSAVAGVTHYYLWVDDSRGAALRSWFTAEGAGCASGSGTCSIKPGVSLVGSSTWWVQTWNVSGGYGPWSAGLGFQGPPAAAIPRSPTGSLSTATPTFTWSAVPAVTHYYLWVTDSHGVAVATWFGATAAGCGAGTGLCSVTPGVSLTGAGTWWVQTWNATGGYGPWSAGLSYSVQLSTGAGKKLRVLQWNLHHGVGTDDVYDINRIATWMANMTPDIVMLNEVEKNTYWGHEDQPARYEALLESKTGKAWYSVFIQEFGQWSANGKGHLILSTFPIQSTAMQSISYDRAIGLASVVVNGRSLSLIVTHLDPDNQTIRLQQAREVIAWSATFAENRVLAGDMNAWPDQASVLEFNQTYADSWTDAVNRGTAVGVAGISPNGATKNGRIDYIMRSKGASNLVVLDSKVWDTRDGGGNMPSDHRPVVTTFEVR